MDLRFRHSHVERVRLNRRQPAVRVKDLALMLEIDLCLGRRGDFRRRLQRALDDAARQGITKN